MECHPLVGGEPTEENEDTSLQQTLAWPLNLMPPAWPDWKAFSDMPPSSVYLLRLFPGLASFQKDLDQRQEDGHSHRQKKWDVDSKFLVIREI